MPSNYIKIHFRYSELGLKGKNINIFEQILISNIKKALNFLGIEFKEIVIKQKQGIILLPFREANSNNDVLARLALLPGIKWVGNVLLSKNFKVLSDISSVVVEFLVANNIYISKLNVKRYDKSLQFNSNDVWLNIKKGLQNISKHYNNVTGQKNVLQLLIFSDYFELINVKRGIGGLPVGSTGRGLVLFSGGIDSPVATFLMTKRGIKFDLIHFTPLGIDEIKQSKIYKIYKQLKIFNPDSRLFIAHIPFIKEKLVDTRNQRKKISRNFKIYNPMIFFKHIIFKVAEQWAKKIYKQNFILISGDSLGQVSSQTISNLVATEFLLEKKTIVARPCIGLNKEEIIEIAKFINTYEYSIKEYKDCCSNLSKNSKTETQLSKLQEQDKNLGIEKIVNDSIKTIKLVD